jgi:hypothetical protein
METFLVECGSVDDTADDNALVCVYILTYSFESCCMLPCSENHHGFGVPDVCIADANAESTTIVVCSN